MNDPKREPTHETSALQEVLTFGELRDALKRCMAENPPMGAGAELQLHPDAKRLADLFRKMIDQRLDSVCIEAIEVDALQAYRQWR